MPTLKERLQRLEDLAAIQRMLREMLNACDEPYNAERVAALFTEDGLMELGPLGRYEGQSAIQGAIADVGRRILFTRHYQCGHLIEI